MRRAAGQGAAGPALDWHGCSAAAARPAEQQVAADCRLLAACTGLCTCAGEGAQQESGGERFFITGQGGCWRSRCAHDLTVWWMHACLRVSRSGGGGAACLCARTADPSMMATRRRRTSVPSHSPLHSTMTPCCFFLRHTIPVVCAHSRARHALRRAPQHPVGGLAAFIAGCCRLMR